MSACKPVWFINGEECPHGIRLPFDVTWPSNIDAKSFLAVVYSLFPIVLVGVCMGQIVLQRRSRGTREISFVLFVASMTAFSEYIIKNIPSIEAPRPGSAGHLLNVKGLSVGSCCTDCGMPSSHSAVAMGILLLSILECSGRVMPSVADHEWAEEGTDRGNRPSVADEEVRDVRFDYATPRDFVSILPFLPAKCITHRQFSYFVLVWCHLLLPVPLMRIILYDHTAAQVMVGMLWGCVCATVFYAFKPKLLMLLGRLEVYGVIQNAALPGHVPIVRQSERSMWVPLRCVIYANQRLHSSAVQHQPLLTEGLVP